MLSLSNLGSVLLPRVLLCAVMSDKGLLSTIDDSKLDANKDWDAIVNELASGRLKHKWKTFARKLHIGNDKIETIAKTHSKDPDKCVSEVVREWLKGKSNTTKSGEPSWRKLAQAVESLDGSLFRKIAENHHKTDHLYESSHFNTIYTILSKHAGEWRSIGLQLGFLPRELDQIQQNILLLPDGSLGYLGEMLSKWLQWVPGDGRGSKSFATLEQLQSALNRIGLAALALEIGNDLGGNGNLLNQPPVYEPPVNILECIKRAFSLKFLMCGKTGVGKSSLINSLVGFEACKVSNPAMKRSLHAGTTKVSAVKANVDGVLVSIYDSPGLQDGVVDERAYLKDMYKNCRDAHLFLYCVEMPKSPFDSADMKAIQLITEHFGSEFWNRCVLVLTKANMVWIPPNEGGDEREYHKRLYDNIVKTFRNQLIQQGVPKKVAHAIPGVAAGWYQPEHDDLRYVWYVSDREGLPEERVDFLTELWTTCFETISSAAQFKLVKATNYNRTFVKPKQPPKLESKKQIKEKEKEEEEEKEKMHKTFEDMLNSGGNNNIPQSC